MTETVLQSNKSTSINETSVTRKTGCSMNQSTVQDAKNENQIKNWYVKQEKNSANKTVTWFFIDKCESSANSMNTEVLLELETLLNQFDESKSNGLVIASGKSSGFIAGADIHSLRQAKGPDEIMDFIRLGHRVYDKLAAIKQVPTIALISGFCLGGGMELALACKYRIAVDTPKTRLGVPEVMLGIHPGWGGTVRLGRAVNQLNAMDLMLTGRGVRAKQAKRMGLVDAVVPERVVSEAVASFVDGKGRKKKASFWDKLQVTSPMRQLLAIPMRRQVQKKVNEKHYPAPFAIIDWFKKYGPYAKNGLNIEMESINKLLQHDTTKQLVQVFYLREHLKNQAKASDAKFKHLHVIGAGVMGGDIANWAVANGMTVTLQDRSPESLSPAIGRAHKLFQRKFKDRLLARDAMDRLIPDLEGDGLKKADIIIEAAFENLDVKREIFKNVEENAKPDAIIATNTSSFPLNEISANMNNPERLVGIHFFNPVSKMPLVEVIYNEQTSQDVVNKSHAFVGQIDKLGLSVKSSPGFLVNRVLMPFLNEGMILMEEGVDVAVIDAAAKDFGMPMGPVELADTVGLDVCLSVAKNLATHYDIKIPEILSEKVKNGKLGVKSGEGFYKYQKGKAIKPKGSNAKHSDDMTNRLVFRLLNETLACYREGLVASSDDVDAGLIFGAGFAPYTGGPLQYIKSKGVESIASTFDDLSSRYGERFKPDEGLKLISAE